MEQAQISGKKEKSDLLDRLEAGIKIASDNSIQMHTFREDLTELKPVERPHVIEMISGSALKQEDVEFDVFTIQDIKARFESIEKSTFGLIMGADAW